MDKLEIIGGNRLEGIIDVSGAKNAALPLMITTLLTNKPVTLNNVPALADIKTLSSLLESLGCAVKLDSTTGTMVLETKSLSSHRAEYDLVRKMRASIFVLGPLLAHHKQAEVSLPGGCAIGTRPVDLHLEAMEALGATIDIKEGYIFASAPDGLVGAEIIFSKVSVGATENALMAATLAKGTTKIRNAAKEPEVVDLAECLNKMGAQITGAGTDTIIIEGVESLDGTTHDVVADRIEAGSYAIAACVTQGDITLTHLNYKLLDSFWSKLKECGADVRFNENGENTVRIIMDKAPNAIDVMTEPYPGYPTDLQAQIMALNCVSQGAGMVTETIFENRFMHVPELCRLGANITVHSNSALVRGVEKLNGAPVMATDLRASMALVLAGLAANGKTTINRLYHLDRGYENLEKKLTNCGAKIERVKE